ncbi:MAG: HEAT repeat domain-containing protein, partial [Caldilineaceae bacterium SB0666_bin_21]|nr:HEAT repeat domain-containing protein [Caldilineaceae bacterium SB0666_bin_21]
LGDIGVPARGAIPALVNAMEDDSEWVRRNAAFSLGILDNDGTSAAVLGRHLSDAAPRVAQNSSLALCKMARNAQDAAGDLKQAVSSDVKYVKTNSQLALHIMDN